MSETGTRRIEFSLDIKPHAYDPITQPEYFEGVLPRRMLAFCIDVIVLAIPVLIASLFIFMFGIVTLGLGWALFWLLPTGAAVWGVLYYGLCFGSRGSATVGMRAMDLEMRTWYGAPSYFLLGAVHAVGYWISVSTLTPFVVFVALLNSRRRLLHDILLGTVVINNEARAQALRRATARRT